MSLSTAIELAQALVASIGLTLALREAHASVMVWRANHTTARGRIVSEHYVLIECLRLGVHTVVLLTAGLMLAIPPVPADMPWQWAVIARKSGYLLIALIALTGTWSARRTRLRLWESDTPTWGSGGPQ